MRLTLLLALPLLSACVTSAHATRPSPLGTARSSDELVTALATPGPIELETVASCDWTVPRAGLLNLAHPAAKAAHLEDGPEPIQVFFHVITHPTRGTFLIDSGVEKALRDAPEKAAIRGLVASEMHVEQMKFLMPLGDWLAAHPGKIEGLFLTHLHLDHVSGLPDLPRGTPLYAGPGETATRNLLNLVVQPNVDRELEGFPALSEWPFSPDAAGRFAGVVDIFGDGSAWAISVPGHTAGSTAYLLRTPRGPVLLTGDCSHTRWGWEHAVEPGTFTADQALNARSLGQLEALVAAHPEIEVRLGHQR